MRETRSPAPLLGWLAFAALITALCAWILSLPLFPSQDGAAHVYYAKVSRDLLLGHSAFAHDFRIARPFPPYSLHAYLLMALLQGTSPELAEKLLACLCVIVGGFGFAYLARQLGRSASLPATLAAPFLLHRWVFFGFYGYALGVGVALAAIGVWLRPRKSARQRAIFFFATALTLLAHPVPYLVVVAFAWSALLCGWWNARSVPVQGEIERPQRGDLLALIAASAVFLYILRYSQSGMLWNYELLADLHDKLFRIIDVFRTWDVLPLQVPLYNITAGVLLLVVVLAGCRRAVAEAKTGKITRVQLVIGWAFLILIALPLLPRTMNGSGFFAARFSIWPALLFFAGAASVELNWKAERILTVTAVAVTAFTIVMLNARIGPVARQLDLSMAPPFGLAGAHVFTRSNSRPSADLTFDPYEWAAVRVVDREGAILVDSPWMDLQIMMLDEIGPKVRFEGDNGVRITSGPAARIAMVFTRCGNVRGEGYADRIVAHHPARWRMQKYGCFAVLEPLP